MRNVIVNVKMCLVCSICKKIGVLKYNSHV